MKIIDNLNWRKELIDQSAHLLVCLLICWLVGPDTFGNALFLAAGLWAVREHGQHGFNFTDGSARDLVGWQLGGLIYWLAWIR